MKQISLHVHSFSLRYALRHRAITGYDVFAYIDEMAQRGFTGVNVSAPHARAMPIIRAMCSGRVSLVSSSKRMPRSPTASRTRAK